VNKRNKMEVYDARTVDQIEHMFQNSLHEKYGEGTHLLARSASSKRNLVKWLLCSPALGSDGTVVITARRRELETTVTFEVRGPIPFHIDANVILKTLFSSFANKHGW
jgi:hypothetical protein